MKASDVRYLVDAGPLISWFSRRDQWHDWSTQILQAVDDVLWTSEAVFAEACYQLGGNTPEVAALAGLADGGHLRLLSALGVATGRLRALMAKYPKMEAVRKRRPVEIDDDMLAHQNSMQVVRSERFLFSPANDFSLAQERIEKFPELKTGRKLTFS